MDCGQPKSDSDGERLTVVGVGASAGGLEALTELLEHMSPDSAMALVVIQHLDPRPGYSPAVRTGGRRS
jgi:two-component system CheB/CheR fusion protein